MEKKNLLLGAFTAYNWDQIKYWVNSIKQLNLENLDIVVVVFNATFETVDKLVENKIHVIAMNKDDEKQMYTHQHKAPIHVERFFHFYHFLKENWLHYDKVLFTDMKDVVFQSDPFVILNQRVNLNTDYDIMCGSECLKYKDEAWGALNFTQCYGEYFFEDIKEYPIMNVGVVGGDAEYMKDLCLNILQNSINRPIPIVDQAVFNQLIRTQPYKDTVWTGCMYEGWVAHLGTVMDPIKIDKFRPLLLEDEPVIDEEEFVATDELIRFAIVHQWDRVPDLVPIIERKYG